jgi:WD40 repeat protein
LLVQGVPAAYNLGGEGPRSNAMKYLGTITATAVLIALGQPACSGQETLAVPQSLGGAVLSVAFSPDGKTMAAGCSAGTVELWEVLAGRRRATLKGHAGGVRSVAFSRGGKLLASGSSDWAVRLWDLTTGQLKATLRGHTGSVTAVAFHPAGKLLASGSEDPTVRLWEVSGNRRAKGTHPLG